MSCLKTGILTLLLLFGVQYAQAKDFTYKKHLTLKVGQSVILKGVRYRCSTTRAPSFKSLRKLPRLKTGILMDGGIGTMQSRTCKGRVAARGIRFKATKKGKETALIYSDAFYITVK
jgi:hypothetical protein